PTYIPQALPRLPALIALPRLEEALLGSMPNDETGHCILVRARPPVLQIDPRKGVVAGVITVKGAILVEEIAFGNEPAIDVAIAEVDGCLAIVLDVGHFFTGAFAESGVKDMKAAVGENNVAFEEGGVFARFSVEGTGQL
ncbi:MAG: hypothetical protein Q9207_008387, partial [Kuettlingeria erythrocarpa]